MPKSLPKRPRFLADLKTPRDGHCRARIAKSAAGCANLVRAA
jgi:hypothetical protein